MNRLENFELNQNQTGSVEKSNNKGEEELTREDREILEKKITAEAKKREAEHLNEEILFLIEYIGKLEKKKSDKGGTDGNYLTALIGQLKEMLASFIEIYEENTGKDWTPPESKPLDEQGHVEAETNKLNENIEFGNED